MKRIDHQGALISLLRELYEIRESSVAFCLAIEGRRAMATGLYDFLPRPLFVFSRWVRSYVRRYTNHAGDSYAQYRTRDE